MPFGCRAILRRRRSGFLARGATARKFLFLIGGTIAGLFIDEARHVWLEERLESGWAKQNGFDLEKLDDFVAYAPAMTVELYQLIRDEFFYYYEYYEFDFNVAFALFIAALAWWLNIAMFHAAVPVPLRGAVSVMSVVVGILFLGFGRNAYHHFLTAFVNAMEHVQPGFRDSLKKGVRDDEGTASPD